MNNPFEQIDARLSNIESLLIDIKHKPVEEDEALLNVQEAAKFLHLTPPTIYSKVSRNELPYMKRGKRLYFSKDDLKAFLRGGSHKVTSVTTEKVKFKDPIDICVIPEVCEAMIDYRNETSKNQQRQLAVSCKVIKTILLHGIKLY